MMINHVGLLHLSGMTALQELKIEACQAMRAEEMVDNLRSLITEHSLARISLSAELLESLPAIGRQLPCKWIPAEQTYF